MRLFDDRIFRFFVPDPVSDLRTLLPVCVDERKHPHAAAVTRLLLLRQDPAVVLDPRVLLRLFNVPVFFSRLRGRLFSRSTPIEKRT